MSEKNPDEQLVRDVQAGNIGAFETLVRRHQRKLCAFVRRYVRDEQSAEEIVQDAFVTVYKKIYMVDPERKFLSFLFTVAKHAAIDKLRTERPRVRLSDDLMSEGRSALDHLIAREQQKEIQRIIRKISPVQRRVIELFYFDELSYEQISSVLNIPINTVRTHLHRGKRVLKRMLYETHS